MNKSHKALGFTLIEILVVMLIISIVSGITLLSVSHNQNKQVETIAKQLANTLLLAEQQAMLQPAVLGLTYTNNSYAFYSYQETRPDYSWQPLNDKLLGPHHLPDDIQLTLVIDNKIIPTQDLDAPIRPYLIISSSGDTPAFIITLGKKNKPATYRVVGKNNGNVYSEPIPHE